MPLALVVLPDRALAQEVTRALRRAGLSARTVHDFAPALEQGADADLLVCELALPGGDGLALLDALRDRGAAPRALFVAERPTFDDCRRAWRAGALDVCALPLDLSDDGELAFAARTVAAGRARPANELGLCGPATAPAAEDAVREVLAFALRHGAPPAARARLGGAVAEALDNIVQHAYPGQREPGDFSLSARCDGDEIHVRVGDGGAGFDALSARLDGPAAPFPIRELEPGGLSRAAALCEAFAVESQPSGGGTRVTLRVAFTRCALAPEIGIDLSDHDHLDPELAKRVLRAIQRRKPDDLFNVPPAIAVAIGRMLTGRTPSQLAQSTLWS